MIHSTRRFLLPLVCVAALAGSMLAATAEPAFALATPTVVTTSSGLASVSGQSVTFTSTVTGTGVTPTGTVDFLDGVTSLCATRPLASTVTNVATATCTTTALAVATHSITSSYSGDATYDPTTSVAVSQVVSKAGTTTGLTSGTNPSAFGGSVTFTATVAAVAPGTGTPTGTVDFKNGVTDITGCAAKAMTAGVATCTTTTLPVAANSITAIYSNDANFNTSTSTALVQNVGTATSTTTVLSATNPSVFSGPVTFTANVSSTGGTPTGNVEFKAAGNVIAGCSAKALTAGAATCTTSALAVGTQAITAEYASDGSFASSTSTAVSQVVNKAGTTSAVASSDLTTTFGDPVTFTATIAPVSPATATPSIGTVSFNADGVPIDTCGAKALTGGVATCATTSDPAGTAQITAVFSGDTNFTASTSPAIAQVVAKAATSTALASNHNPSRSGQAVTFTATVTSTAGTPTGSVTFSRVKDDSTLETLGTGTLTAGVATFTTAALPVQNGHIVADYATTTNYLASTHNSSQNVQRSVSKPFVVSSQKNSELGKPVTFGIVVSPVTPGAGTPTGLVSLYRERANGSRQWIGRGNLRSGETAIRITDLPLGSYKVIAVYRGSTTFRPSERSMTQTVTS
jgi:hypothetical protein